MIEPPRPPPGFSATDRLHSGVGSRDGVGTRELH